MDTGLEQLFEELQREGRVDSAGVFTMDLAQALDKLRRYQLEGPVAWLLPTVASAVLSWASSFRLEAAAGQVTVRFDGKPFSERELRSLFSHLLGSRTGSRLHELAVALNSLAGQCEKLTFSSWEGCTGTELVLAGKTMQVRTMSPPSWAGSHPEARLIVQRKAGVMGRLLGGLRPLSAERDLLARRCALAPVDIELAGRKLEGGLDFSDCYAVAGMVNKACRLRVEVPDVSVRRATASPGDFSALLGFTQSAEEESEVVFVVSGVAYPRRLRLALPGMRVAVATDALVKNFSHTDLVEGPDLHRLISQLNFEALTLAGRVADSLHTLSHGRRAAEALIRVAAAACVQAPSYTPDLPQPLASLVDAPVFRLADGTPTRLRPLLEQYQRVGSLAFSWESCGTPEVDGERIVLMTEAERPALETIFPELRKAGETLEQASELTAARRRWEVQPLLDARLDPRQYLAVAPLLGFEGEVGARTEELREPARIRYLKHYRLLGERVERSLPRGLDVIVNCDSLTPNSGYDAPVKDGVVDRILANVREGLEDFYPTVAFHGDQPVGPGRSQARGHLTAYLGWLGCEAVEFDYSLRAAEVFTTARGASVSLDEVVLEVRERGFVGVITPAQLGGPRRSGELPAFLTLVLESHEIHDLEAFFGSHRVRDASVELKLLKARPEFFRRGIQMAVLPAGMVWKRSFGRGDVRGEVGVPAEGGEPGLEVRVLYEGRVLGIWRHPLGFGPVAGVVECPRLRPNGQMTFPVTDEVWDEVCRVLVEEARLLGTEAAADLASREPTVYLRARSFLWSQLSWELRRFHGDPEKVAAEEIFRQLARLRAFPDLFGGHWSLETLMPVTRTARVVGYLTRAKDRPQHPDEIVLLFNEEERRSLEGVLELLDVVDLAEELRLSGSGDREVVLPAGSYLARGSVEPLEGELGLLTTRERSSIEMLCRRHHYRTFTLDLPIPIRAVVNHDAAASSRRVPEAVLEHLQERSRHLVLELAREGKHRLYLLALLARQPDLLADVPLVRDLVSGGLVPPSRVTGLFLPVHALAAEQAAAARQVARERGLEVLPVLDEKEQELLYDLVSLRPVDQGFFKAVRAVFNRARPKLASLRLEECFPGRQWVARQSLEVPGYLGEIGLPLEAEPGCLKVCVGRVPLASVAVDEVLGVVDGPFEPDEEFAGLADPASATAVIEAATARLLAGLAGCLPELSAEGRSRVLRASANLRTVAAVEEPAVDAGQWLPMLQASVGRLLPGEGWEVVLAALGSRTTLVQRRDRELVLNADHALLRRLADQPDSRLGLQLLALWLAREGCDAASREQHRRLMAALLG